MANKAPVFAADIAENYHRHLVPFYFDAYAADLARRVEAPSGGRVLELACGTGAVTRHLRETLADSADLVASDLNPGMLDFAKSTLAEVDSIEFKIADGADLPFENESFDAVVCQFGVMFFPDKLRSFSEAARVLKPGGRLHFSVWDSLEYNPFSKLIHETVLAVSPDNPILFMATPFAYCDVSEIKKSLEAAGFRHMNIEVKPHESRIDSVDGIVTGTVAGSPLAAEFAERGLTDEGRRAVGEAVQAHIDAQGHGAAMQAVVFSATKPA